MNVPEEAVHLAAGMLTSDFHSVIATMWSIGDPDAPVVMKALYEYLLHDAKDDSAQSTYDLHYVPGPTRKGRRDNVHAMGPIR